MYSKLAYLGPEFSYHYLATQLIDSDFELISCSSFEQIFEQVEIGNYGLIAVQNKIVGRLKDNYKRIIDKKLLVEQIVKLPIDHCLIGLNGSKSNLITKVYSHPIAIAQCSNFLEEMYVETVASTSQGANLVLQQNNMQIASIGSAEIANHLNLTVLNNQIQNELDNWTEFWLIKKN
jgi:chorismate mutase / prephenate dehydratase